MPIYEYECSNCKFYVEALQKISDKPLKQCPSCKKQTLNKLVSAPSFRLKGGGWYETDFKSDKEDKRNLADREEAPTGEDAKPEAKKEDKAVDAKPAAKPEKETKPVKTAVTKAKPKAAKPAAKPKGKGKAKAKAKPAKKRR